MFLDQLAELRLVPTTLFTDMRPRLTEPSSRTASTMDGGGSHGPSEPRFNADGAGRDPCGPRTRSSQNTAIFLASAWESASGGRPVEVMPIML